jgi:hypothetical protein
MSDEIQQAAERLIHEVQVHSRDFDREDLFCDDIEAVAAFAQTATTRLAAAETEIARLRAALISLWDVTIVGHQEGGDCPYQVGHSPTEHVVFGHGIMSLEAWVASAKPESIAAGTVDTALSWPGEAALSDDEKAEARRVMRDD